MVWFSWSNTVGAYVQRSRRACCYHYRCPIVACKRAAKAQKEIFKLKGEPHLLRTTLLGKCSGETKGRQYSTIRQNGFNTVRSIELTGNYPISNNAELTFSRYLLCVLFESAILSFHSDTLGLFSFAKIVVDFPGKRTG